MLDWKSLIHGFVNIAVTWMNDDVLFGLFFVFLLRMNSRKNSELFRLSSTMNIVV